MQPQSHLARHKATAHDEARFVCESLNGVLVSVGNAVENTFLTGLMGSTRNLTADSSLWIGMGIDAAELSVSLVQSSFWDDGTPIVYTNWADDVKDLLRTEAIADVSGIVLRANGNWDVEPEDTALPFACERPALHVETDCNCTGVTDAAGEGGTCDLWGASSTGTADENLSWCYTSPHCPRAAPVPGSEAPAPAPAPSSSSSSSSQQQPKRKKLWRAYCTDVDNPTVCDAGEFYSEASLTCMPVTSCGAGEYVSAAPSGKADMECAACPPHTYQPLSRHRSPACTQQPACGAGEKYVESPDGREEAQCAPCPLQTFQAADSHRDANCTAVQPCTAGTFYAPLQPVSNAALQCTACAADEWRGEELHLFDTCIPWQQCIADVQVENAVPTSTSDRICSSTDPCMQGLQYELKPATASSPRECSALEICLPGSKMVVRPTLTTNRVCEVCPPGTWQDAANLPECKSAGVCGFGERALLTATASSDLLCGVCPAGTWQPLEAHREATCRPQTLCGEKQYFIPSSSAANASGTCEECPPGQFQELELHRQEWCANQPKCGGGEQYVDAGPNNLGRCEPCDEGDYRDRGPKHREQCAQQPPCGAGLFAVPPIPLDELRKCRQCPEGTWEPRSDRFSTECLPWTECGGGADAAYYELVAPTVVSDRVCRAQAECGALEYEVAAPTPTSARECSTIQHSTCYQGTYVVPISDFVGECRPCKGGTFQNLENQPECKPWSTCSVGQQLVVQGTVVSDAFCVDCLAGYWQPLQDHVEAECVAKQRCGTGERVQEPSGRDPTVDSVCIACFPGMYQDEQDHLDADCKLQPNCVPTVTTQSMSLNEQYICASASSISNNQGASLSDNNDDASTGSTTDGSSKLAGILAPILVVVVVGLIMVVGWLNIKNKAAQIEIMQLRVGDAAGLPPVSNFHNPMWGQHGGSGESTNTSGIAAPSYGDLDNGYDSFPTGGGGQEPIYDDLPGSVEDVRNNGNSTRSPSTMDDYNNSNGNEHLYGILPNASTNEKQGMWSDSELRLLPERPSSARSTRSTASMHSVLNAPPRRGSTEKRTLVLDSDDDEPSERPPTYTAALTYPNALPNGSGGGGGGVLQLAHQTRRLPQLPTGVGGGGGVLPPMTTSMGSIGGAMNSSSSSNFRTRGGIGGRGGGIMPPSGGAAGASSMLGSALQPPPAFLQSVGSGGGGGNSSYGSNVGGGGALPIPTLYPPSAGRPAAAQVPRTRTISTPVDVSAERSVHSGIRRCNDRIAQHLADAEDLLGGADESYDRGADAPKPRARGAPAANLDSEA